MGERAGLIAALTERWSEDEETTISKGKSRKRTTGQRTMSAWDAYDRMLSRMITLARELCLTPAAMARARMDIQPKFDLALAIASLEDSDGR